MSDNAEAPKKPRAEFIRNEKHDVFKRINMHDGDTSVCWEYNGRHHEDKRGNRRPLFMSNNQRMYVSRVVFELYTGIKLNGPKHLVRHTCDNTWCCNPTHLVAGDQFDNMADMVKRERVGLKHIHVRKIMQMIEVGMTSPQIKTYMLDHHGIRVDDSVVRKIKRRELYKAIEWPWGDELKASKSQQLESVSSHGNMGNEDHADMGHTFHAVPPTERQDT